MRRATNRLAVETAIKASIWLPSLDMLALVPSMQRVYNSAMADPGAAEDGLYTMKSEAPKPNALATGILGKEVHA